MIPQLIIAYTTEGKTDQRFLENIIQRTFEQIIFAECQIQMEILPLQYIPKTSGDFRSAIIECAKKAFQK